VFWRFLRGQPRPLTGAPSVRRLKRYTAQTGFVYQYCYRGYRARPGGVEHVFEVAAGGARGAPISIRLPDDALSQWETSHRELARTERYAIAKIALFRAFDERSTPSEIGGLIAVTAADVVAALDTLGID
jgi:hypothetical protein